MDKLLEPHVFPVLMVFGVPIVAIVASTWYKLEKVRSNNDLKRRMIDSGLSVEEIERVLNAGSKKNKGK